MLFLVSKYKRKLVDGAVKIYGHSQCITLQCPAVIFSEGVFCFHFSKPL